MSDIKGYKCPHCEYYMWEGKEFYECEFQDKVSELEQENETLKTKIFRVESKQTSMCKQNKELIEDNLNLSKENEKLKALCDTYKTCYQAKHSDIKCLLPKYCTTLQEIKAIAETYLTDCQGFKCDAMEEILQKIREVE